MALALALDEADFESSLTRRYLNTSWFRLAPLIVLPPVAMIVGALMPMGVLLMLTTLVVVVAGALSVSTRALMMPRELQPHASKAERMIQVAASVGVVLFVAAPLFVYISYLMISALLGL